MSITKRLDEAREAFRHGDRQAAATAHEPERIAAATRAEYGSAGAEYLGDLVYGGLDGIITTLAVVSGAAGAELGPGIVLVLGVANLVADGFSMGAGAYLSAKSDKEHYAREREREAWELENFPDGERAELFEIYRVQGYSQADAQTLVDVKTRDRKRWLDAMMVEELGLMSTVGKPLVNGLATLLAFVGAGILPLTAYLLNPDASTAAAATFRMSLLLSGLSLFGLGAVKGGITRQRALRSGTEMLLAGGIAASVAYLVGALLKGLVQPG